jgi:hypothetical protein
MSALQEAVCGICARRLNRREYEIQQQPLQSLPNAHRLIPREQHPNHDTYNGILLEPAGVDTEHQSQTMVNTCKDCRKSLHGAVEAPPPLSLAAGLWIGRTPIELASLTIPEALLIAHKYPRAFVCKLWPKDRRGANPANLQRALKGNVTSFDLRPQAVADMVAGNLMPRPPRLLASLISITFISWFPLPASWLKGTFRVRREKVRSALEWLKRNNRHYSDIEINEERLAELPEDDVPEDLIDIIRQERDEIHLARENDTYVPEDTEENQLGLGKYFYVISANSLLNDGQKI